MLAKGFAANGANFILIDVNGPALEEVKAELQDLTSSASSSSVLKIATCVFLGVNPDMLLTLKQRPRRSVDRGWRQADCRDYQINANFVGWAYSLCRRPVHERSYLQARRELEQARDCNIVCAIQGLGTDVQRECTCALLPDSWSGFPLGQCGAERRRKGLCHHVLQPGERPQPPVCALLSDLQSRGRSPCQDHGYRVCGLLQ